MYCINFVQLLTGHLPVESMTLLKGEYDTFKACKVRHMFFIKTLKVGQVSLLKTCKVDICHAVSSV